jgi:hypothetical protein
MADVPTATERHYSTPTAPNSPPYIIPASQNALETVPSNDPTQYNNPTTTLGLSDTSPHDQAFDEHGADFMDTYYDYDPSYDLSDEDDDDNTHLELNDDAHATPIPASETQSPPLHSSSPSEPGRNHTDDSNDEIPPDDDFTAAKAFDEIPAVRLAYLQAIQSNTYGGVTVIQTNIQLRSTLHCIALSLPGGLPQLPIPATTLKTVKRRFGINVDDYITQIPICTACFKPYSLDEIGELASSQCTARRCNGRVYEEVERKGGRIERKPAKIQPYVSLIATIRRFLQRPDFVRNLCNTADAVNRPPLDDNTIMFDVHDGDQWVKTFVGLERKVENDGTVRDVPAGPNTKKLLIECEMGLSLTLNIDW